MNFDYFPPSYNKKLDAMTQDSIDRENMRSRERQENIKQQPGKAPEATSFFTGGGIVGAGVGVFACVSNVSSGYENALDPLGLWFQFAIKSMHKSNNSDAIVQVEYEKLASANRIEDILNNKERDSRNYYQQFEMAAQQMSVNFAESELAIEVIEWMTKGFAKTIDAADRRSHIQQIDVPFVFHTFKNRINCNLGTFDFEIKRCRALNGPLEQTALARAIASAIQLNITMKYPQDVSGTNIVTNIEYSYGEDFVSTTISYTAPNGNFRAVRDWN